MQIRGYRVGPRLILALATHVLILVYARNAPRAVLVSIFIYFVFRILAVKAFLTIYRIRPTERTKEVLYWFARKPGPMNNALRFSVGGCLPNLLLFGTIAYVATWVSYLSVAPDTRVLADVGKGIVIFLVYDVKSLISKDIALELDETEERNYEYNTYLLGSLIPLGFLFLPGLMVTKWLDVDASWGLLVPLVVGLMILDIEAEVAAVD